ncbi:protein LTO1 homolog [Thrips palmi]|uniref:Protein LTO1 homolog n=1 Tax=Thrips palmi TaxID=161013 RepID=A0A6P8Z518_THRPL|nr:protein LTO1 homolog [Thrips palmi]
MAAKAENDVNSAFDDIFRTESRLSSAAFEDGFESGRLKGAEEGFHLGYHRGAELGAELGFYSGVVEAWLSLESNVTSERALQSLRKLQQLLKNFPRTNVDNVDIMASFDEIRVSYRKVCSLLKMNSSYPEASKLSF